MVLTALIPMLASESVQSYASQLASSGFQPSFCCDMNNRVAERISNQPFTALLDLCKSCGALVSKYDPEIQMHHWPNNALLFPALEMFMLPRELETAYRQNGRYGLSGLISI